MSQRVGSARSSFGNAKAGDQCGGKEVSTQAYYDHSKGWNVLICTVPGACDLIAEAMEKACANDDIGYDQPTRNTLRENVCARGFDPSKTTKTVNTDCSALVRVCIEYALHKLGCSDSIPNFTTGEQLKKLKETGIFRQLCGKYETGGKYLPRGAVLVTKSKGHTVVVLDDGAKCDVDTGAAKCAKLGARVLKTGSSGDDVKQLQTLLIRLGYDCGRWGVDGDFGDSTKLAVERFQQMNGLVMSGIADAATVAAIRSAEAATPTLGKVRIYGGKCYCREAPDTGAETFGTCKEGTEWEYLGEESCDGWLKIRYLECGCGWVSGKYGRRV